MTENIRKKIASGKYRINYRSLYGIVAVFTLCGLWHGAGWNYIAWGGFHGIILAMESLWLGNVLKRLWYPVQHAYLMFIVMAAWIFFRIPHLSNIFSYFKALVGMTESNGLRYHVSLYIDNVVILAIIAGILGATPIMPTLARRLSAPRYVRLVPCFEFAGLFLVMSAVLVSLASSTFTPFIYQKF
jgi:alginate O-acetyltransferase complex protein AlgI